MFKKFKFVVCFLILVGTAKFANAQWKKVYTTNNADLYDIQIVGNTAYTLGNSGVVLKSTDTGNSWKKLSINPVFDLRTLHFLDTLTGFVTGENARMMKTTDGGKTWTQRYVKTAAFAYDMAFYNNHGVAIGKDMLAISSTDFGDNWTVDTTQVKFRKLNALTIMPDGNCWAVGDSGYIIHKHVSEKRWKKMNSPTSISLAHISHLGNAILMIGGGYPDTLIIGKYHNIFAFSYDTGKTWQQGKIGEMKIINNAFFSNPDSGFIIGSSGLISKWNTGFNNRKLQLTGTASALNKITFSQNIGIIVGDGGTILRTNNNGGPLTPLSLTSAVKSDINIYPNPSLGSFNIDGNIQGATIQVMDMQGRLILEKKSNSTTIQFQIEVPGFYLVSVTNGVGVVSRTLLEINH